MKQYKNLMHLLLALALLLHLPVAAAELIKAAIVKYQIVEPNIAPYITRMVVTSTRVRMDDGENSANFLIFSRGKGVIESVNHEEQTILEIHSRGVTIAAPMPLQQVTEEISLADAPVIAGVAPRQYQLSVNGVQCQSVVSIDGLLPDVVMAWRQFRQVLAGEHAATLPFIPADQQSGCDLALNIYAPEWFLNYGLPVQSLVAGSKGMLLLDYVEDAWVEPALFELPDGYHRYSAE